ncbi:hypothetical protein [Ruania zhangjianzhongii]|uniref:hypothetical protein n=1 Tax=Ruania zhangjianzhongii TaxID=2603206 RepID=UPI0011C87EF3|nr:hypothetical protein [Ruania zhangjianzhongii]
MSTETPPPDRPHRPVLVGANPGLQLFDAQGECTGYVSVWRVDWSRSHGTGTALVLWQPTGVRVLSSTLPLARWLTEDFTRHFPELDGLDWPQPQYEQTPVETTIDLAQGLSARAGDVEVRLAQVLDVRSVATGDFPLGGVPHTLRLVLGPCQQGQLSIAGRQLGGQVRRSGTTQRPSSSAFLAEAEVWSRRP